MKKILSVRSIFERLFKTKKLKPENSRQPQDSSDGQKVIARLLELTSCEDLRIDERRQIYFVKDGKPYWAMLKSDMSPISICETKVWFKTDGIDMSYTNLSPELCDRLVLESLCGTFFGEFSGRVALIPITMSILELAIKLDLIDSIFVPYNELASMVVVPNWFNILNMIYKIDNPISIKVV